MGEVVYEVHAISAGHTLILVPLTKGLVQVCNGFLIEFPLGIRKGSSVIVPPPASKSPADLAVFFAVLNVNLKGTFFVSQAAALQMIKQGNGGKIINTSSIGALGNIGQANYAASKAGVVGLTKTLALELARHGIAVNCVSPGATRTPMTETIPEKVMEGLLKLIPFRRMAEPEEIAAMHAFLASDDASYITGQVIFVDGGISVGV